MDNQKQTNELDPLLSKPFHGPHEDSFTQYYRKEFLEGLKSSSTEPPTMWYLDQTYTKDEVGLQREKIMENWMDSKTPTILERAIQERSKFVQDALLSEIEALFPGVSTDLESLKKAGIRIDCGFSQDINKPEEYVILRNGVERKRISFNYLEKGVRTFYNQPSNQGR